MSTEETGKRNPVEAVISRSASPDEETSIKMNATVNLVNDKPPDAINKLELIKWMIDLVKAMIWPALIVYLFLELKGPLQQVLTELPEKVSEAQKISLGSFSLEVEHQAIQTGGMKLADTLRNLSPQSIAELMQIGNNVNRLVGEGHQESADHFTYFLPGPGFTNILDELAKHGLVKFDVDPQSFDTLVHQLPLKETGGTTGRGERLTVEYTTTRPLTPEEQAQLFKQMYQLTDLGKRAFDSVVSAVVQQLRSSNIAEEHSSRTD